MIANAEIWEERQFPTAEQVAAIDDVQSLQAIQAEIDARARKIEVDLEYGDGDDDWAARARGALGYARSSLGHIERRIKKLTRSEQSAEDRDYYLEKKGAKAAVHEAREAAMRAEAEKKKASLALAREETRRMRVTMLDTAMLQGHFVAVAARELDADTFARIMNAALKQQNHTLRVTIG